MNFWRYLQLFLISLLSSVNTYSQVGIGARKQNVNPFDEVNKLYRETNLNDTLYMKKMDSVANDMLDKGVFFDVDELARKFKIYKKIAWDNHDDPVFKQDYYTVLFNNMYMASKWGGAMYYAEKIAKEREKTSGYSFLELSLEMELYISMERDDKVIVVYEKELERLEDFAKALEQNPDKFFIDGMVSMRIFQCALISYSVKKDIQKVEKTRNLTKRIIQYMNKAKQMTGRGDRLQLEFYSLYVDYVQSYAKDDYKHTLVIIDAMDDLVKSHKEFAEYASGIAQFKIDVFLETKKADSALFYIERLEKDFGYLEREPILVNKFKAKAQIIKGNYEEASKLLLKALEDSFEKKRKIAEEMDALLYAQTEAEHHRLAFEESEAEKRERNVWIVIISSFLIIVIIGGAILLRLKNRELRKTLKDLEETAGIYITLMKQLEFEVRKEEQQLLSQNLHDDLAGTLAAIKNNIDLQVVDADENKKRQELLHLSEMLNEVYHSVRNKSHQLFKGAQLPSEEIFCQYITNLAHIAFPDKYYDFNIQIDDYSLVNTTIEFRSELIRVIQEAFANIVKHAKATQVSLLIYKESEKISVVIKDNGKGFGAGVKGNALGVLNMQSRLKQFDADFSVNSGNSGVEIIITIPENTTVR